MDVFAVNGLPESTTYKYMRIEDGQLDLIGGEELNQQCGAVIVNIRVGKALIILKLHQTAMVCTSQVNPSHFSNFSCI